MVRLLRETRGALQNFDHDPPARAHFLRTRMKRIQSLSRLLPDAGPWRRKFLPTVRELKDLFADFRDAGIVQDLAERYAPGEAQHLRAAAHPDTLRALDLAGQAASMLSAYKGWEEASWRCIAARAVSTFRAARGAWKEARRSGSPDSAFHAWRRRVKRLLYQCEYLGSRAPVARLTLKVDRLGEVLGELQDVCIAEDWINEHVGSVPRDLSRCKKNLRARALVLGRSLFATKGRHFQTMLKRVRRNAERFCPRAVV